MENNEFERRLTHIENRLNQLELKLTHPADQKSAVSGKTPAQIVRPTKASDFQASTASEKQPSSITSILGWVGSTALVLAAAYLIRLAIDTGWLTPLRQIVFAVLGGAVLIGTGFTLRSADRRYAGLLPAGGIVILFLSVYGAHLRYGLIGPESAAAAVVFVCVV